MHSLTLTAWVTHSALALLQLILTTVCSSADRISSEVADWLQVAIVPNTLAFNHVLAALHKAAAGTPTPEVRVALAESGVSLFNQMLNRGRTPPDTTTFDTLMALLTSVGAAGQALHVHQLKMQQVCAHPCSCFSRLSLLLESGVLPDLRPKRPSDPQDLYCIMQRHKPAMQHTTLFTFCRVAALSVAHVNCSAGCCRGCQQAGQGCWASLHAVPSRAIGNRPMLLGHSCGQLGCSRTLPASLPC